MTHYTIRPARDDELQRIQWIEQQAATRFADVGLPAATTLPVQPLDALTNDLLQQRLVVAADAADAPVGFIVFDDHPDETYVRELDVLPAHSGHGLGRRLMEHVADRARGRGASRLTLVTFRDIPFNAPYYARMGFRVLSPSEEGPWIAAVRQAERAHGIELAPRVAMALDLGATRIEDVLGFWFGALDANGCADQTHQQRWFTKDPEFDEEIRARFGALHHEVATGQHHGWLASTRGLLASVIVLDQFSRNMFRGSGRMFAFDGQALAISTRGVDAGADRMLAHDERGFFYMPFMHSEDLAMQDRCVELFTAWRDSLQGELRQRVELNLDFAHRHRDIIKRFGRFPHRNALLGRTSTPEELEFLKQPGSSF